MTANLPKPPVTNAEVDDAWLALIRDLSKDGKWVLRPGPIAPIIEARRFASLQWIPVAMPSGSAVFTNAAERDLVLARLLKTSHDG